MFTLRDESDTVVALATARAPGARAVLRIVGPGAVEVAGAVFQPDGADALARARGASTIDGRVRVQDVSVPATAWVFRAPSSYTGDDAVELHLSSCLPLLERLEEALVAAGARAARPGELTRRAFLAGKLDLAQAEAVQALCQAETDEAARAALHHLRGGLSDEVARLRAALLDALTQVEGALDFADEGIDDELLQEAGVAQLLEGAVRRLDALLARERARPADAIRPRVLLFGPPNAGKSSLLNALVGREAALTSDVAGTTRDDVREILPLPGGMAIELVDLAGVGVGAAPAPAFEPEEEHAAVAREAEARALHALPRADAILLVLDGSAPLDEAGAEALTRVRAAGAPAVLLAQKADLPPRLALPPEPPPETAPPTWELLPVSAHSQVGLAELRARLGAALARPEARSQAAFAPNPRHRASLATARSHAESARTALEAGLGGELVAIDLRDALDALSEITGAETTPEDVLDRIFATFCIGK